MKPLAIFFALLSLSVLSCQAQTKQAAPSEMTAAAKKFLQILSASQQEKARFKFEDEERYNWYFVPRDRKGIPLKELTKEQYEAAMNLLRAALSDLGYKKTTAIIQLELVLREVENASPDYRDPGKYYFSIFGDPNEPVWGWRFEGHHVSLNFSAENNELISGTPGFMGSNPAVVQSGPQKGLQILKDETEAGFAMLNALNAEQKGKTILTSTAPNDIITGNSRKAMINDPKGILYSELTAAQQNIFMQVLNIYINRYQKQYAAKLMKDIETAGLNKLQFAWAGAQEPGIGNKHYYRIQGPTIIIEYDNTQNNGNHVHSVVRDLKNDFGGDQLLDHYKNHKH